MILKIAWLEKILQFEFWWKTSSILVFTQVLISRKVNMRSMIFASQVYTKLQKYSYISVRLFNWKYQKQKLFLSKFRNSRFWQIWMTKYDPFLDWPRFETLESQKQKRMNFCPIFSQFIIYAFKSVNILYSSLLWYAGKYSGFGWP